MPEAMKMFSPRGGVENPTPQQQTSTTPKWMGSTPKAVMTGRSTGVASKMIARARMDAVCQKIGDEQLEKLVQDYLEEE